MFINKLNFSNTLQPEKEASTIQARKTKEKAKHHDQEQIKKRWEENPMHVKYPKRMGKKDVDRHMTNKMAQNSLAEI